MTALHGITADYLENVSVQGATSTGGVTYAVGAIDGGLAIDGAILATTTTVTDGEAFIVALSPSGPPTVKLLGEPGDDGFASIAATNDGDLVVAGTINQPRDSSSPPSQAFVAKLSPTLEERWRFTLTSTQQTFGGNNRNGAERVLAMGEGAIVAGSVGAETGYQAIHLASGAFVLALDAAGVPVWGQSVPGEGVELTRVGRSVYFASQDDTAIYVGRIDDGTLVWQSTLSRTSTSLAGISASASEVIVVGSDYTVGDLGFRMGQGVYAYRLDPGTGAAGGDAVPIAGGSSLMATGVAQGGQGFAVTGIHGTGLSVGSSYFDVGGTSTWNTFVLGLGNDLSFRWAALVGGAGSDSSYSRVALAPDGRALVVGKTDAEVITGPAPIFTAGSFAVQARDLGYLMEIVPPEASLAYSLDAPGDPSKAPGGPPVGPDGTLLLRDLTTDQWQQLCDVYPYVPDASSCTALTDRLGSTHAAQCAALGAMDWEACSTTVQQTVDCWLSLIADTACSGFAACLPGACTCDRADLRSCDGDRRMTCTGGQATVDIDCGALGMSCVSADCTGTVVVGSEANSRTFGPFSVEALNVYVFDEPRRLTRIGHYFDRAYDYSRMEFLILVPDVPGGPFFDFRVIPVSPPASLSGWFYADTDVVLEAGRHYAIGPTFDGSVSALTVGPEGNVDLGFGRATGSFANAQPQSGVHLQSLETSPP